MCLLATFAAPAAAALPETSPPARGGLPTSASADTPEVTPAPPHSLTPTNPGACCTAQPERADSARTSTALTLCVRATRSDRSRRAPPAALLHDREHRHDQRQQEEQ
jgi:hypothetical protein